MTTTRTTEGVLAYEMICEGRVTRKGYEQHVSWFGKARIGKGRAGILAVLGRIDPCNHLD